MMRTACMRLIRRCYESGIIDEVKKRECESFISTEEFHVHVRNLTMMVLLPRKLHIDDDTQAAYLRAAVSRVRFKLQKQKIISDR